MLIQDISNDFFQNIFHSHKSRSLSILIQDDDDMVFLRLHLFKQGVNALRLRNKCNRPYVILQILHRHRP